MVRPDGIPEDVLENMPWVKHVHLNGSREHVTIFGLYDDGQVVAPIEWCTAPFCDSNRHMIEYLIDRGVDPIDAQPPPLLRQRLEMRKGAQ
jgi:hypothetical protein